ncbi:AMP-binding protein [Fluviispira multicolorata]|uniref:AMP-binding protein n=1 Tax=Fluviispira multicolorata TaxID=2654512 RepID=A0A833JFM4_9BACT|nr:AMP-binding protein [Fluviispira multicolorata]KAB8031034.1 AMP-binding protein [Fluviispira multicolorata]
MNIDWYSKDSHFFINPRIPLQEKTRIEKTAEEFYLDSHIFLATSGSTALSSTDLKWVALKKEAILNSALSVNIHLDCHKKDILLNTLPYFHIGGLSLYARAFLSQASLINLYNDNFKWSVKEFVHAVSETKATITSLVPTQIYDIVRAALFCPQTLRAVVVGGGSLAKSLYEKAVALGWNLLPSYGMTECCSQIATAHSDLQWKNDFPRLKIMGHLQLWNDESGKICIAGSSLLSGYILQNKNNIYFHDPKKIKKLENGLEIKYIETTDIGTIEGENLTVIGRTDDVIKIAGENVNLARLDEILLEMRSIFSIHFDLALIFESDDRLGKKVSLVIEGENYLIDEILIKNLIVSFNKNVFPFERIKNFYYIHKIPRTELGKLKRVLLASHIHAMNLLQ